MNGDTFTIIDESGKKDIARIVTAFSYKEKDYIVYSIYIFEDLFEKTKNTLLHKSNTCAILWTRYTKSK